MARKHFWPLVWTEYLAARTFAAMLTGFDVEASQRGAAAMGRFFYRIDRRHRRRAERHLAMAFPERTAAERDVLVRRSFEHVMQLAAELCHTTRQIHIDSWSGRVVSVGLEPVVRLLNGGRPIIFLTGHVGNWEILGYLLAVLGYPLHALFRPLDNRPLNRWLVQVRRRRGLHLITKWNATARMQEVLEGAGALAFVADQNAGDKGLFVPFFNRLASTYKSIGLLAIAHRVPIVCGYAHRLSPGYRFEIGVADLIEPEDWLGQPDPLYYVTARYMRAIEKMVRRRPEQYLWSHRRWKSRPRFECMKQPMTSTLRKRLETLPWMDDATMERMQQPFDGR